MQPFGETIKIGQNLERFRKQAESRGGRILIWGSYLIEDAVLVNARFELLQPPRHIQLHAIPREYGVTLAELKTFQIQQKLASESNYLALLIFGLLRYEENDYDGAINRLTRALDEVQIPDHRVNLGVVHLYRGNSYLSKRELTKAIDDYTVAIKTFQNDEKSGNGLFEATLNQGLAYSMRGDFENSLEDYSKAMQLNPHSPLVYNNLGGLYANEVRPKLRSSGTIRPYPSTQLLQLTTRTGETHGFRKENPI